MDRRPITGSVVDEIERLLSQGIRRDVIASHLGVTKYIVQVIAEDEQDRRQAQPRQHSTAVAPRFYKFIDAATIRMVQRMLAAGDLNRSQIAREADVSPQLVQRIWKGKRLAVSAQRPHVFKDIGEKFLEKPVQCDECQAMIEIVPCRACRARRH